MMGYRGEALARKALCLFGEGERECVRKRLLVWFMAKSFYCHILILTGQKKQGARMTGLGGQNYVGIALFIKVLP